MAPTTIFGWFLGNLPSIESDPAAILGTYGDAGSILSQNALSLVATTSDGELNENTPGETLSYDAGRGSGHPATGRRWSRTAPAW